MKILYIVRGVSGSGKSTLASKLTKHVASADMYFEHDGVYKFDPKALPEAHAFCKGMVKQYMTLGVPEIAVANTFCEYWEAEPYIKLARSNGYAIQILTCHSEFQSVHNVSPETLAKQKKRLENSDDWLDPEEQILFG